MISVYRLSTNAMRASLPQFTARMDSRKSG